MAAQQAEGNQIHTHGANLRARPTRQKEWILLPIVDKITGVDVGVEGQYLTIHPKVHVHIMLAQMKIKQGLLAFGEKGNEAILMELRQLHDKKALMPLQQSNMTHEERSKALWYLRTVKARGQKTTETIYIKRRGQFTNSFFGGNGTLVCNRQRKQVFSCD